MLRLVLIATLTLGTFGFAQTTNNNVVPKQGADWYNQHLSGAVQDYTRIASATTPQLQAIAENPTQPGSMAANSSTNPGADWYNQVLGREVVLYTHINDAVPAAEHESDQSTGEGNR